MFKPKYCCCCASPRTGTLVLGWLSLLGSVLDVLGAFRFVLFTRDDYKIMCFTEDEPMATMCADMFLGTIVSSAIWSIIMVVICGMLLWGVEKNKPSFMLPYIITSAISLVLMGLIVVGSFIALCYFGQVLIAFIILGICGCLYVLYFHFLMVLKVCYYEVKQISMALDGGPSIAYMEHRDPYSTEKQYLAYIEK